MLKALCKGSLVNNNVYILNNEGKDMLTEISFNDYSMGVKNAVSG